MRLVRGMYFVRWEMMDVVAGRRRSSESSECVAAGALRWTVAFPFGWPLKSGLGRHSQLESDEQSSFCITYCLDDTRVQRLWITGL